MADEQKKDSKKADQTRGQKSGEKRGEKSGCAKKEAENREKSGEKSRLRKKTPKPKAKRKKPTRKKPKAKKEPAKKAGKAPAKKAKAKAPAAPPVVKANARYVRIAPRKARLIADQVRGMHIEKARALLQFSPRGAAHDIHKLINSAAANAENNHDLIGDEMRVASITVDEGPTLRRFRPRAMGRATPINKRTSHIAVALTPVED